MPTTLIAILLMASSRLSIGEPAALLAQSRTAFVGTISKVGPCTHVFAGFANAWQEVQYTVDDVLKGSPQEMATVAHLIDPAFSPVTEDACLDPRLFAPGNTIIVFTQWSVPGMIPPDGAEFGGRVLSKETGTASAVRQLSSGCEAREEVIAAASTDGSTVQVRFADGLDSVLTRVFFRTLIGNAYKVKPPSISSDSRSVLFEVAFESETAVESIVLTWTPSAECTPRAWTSAQAAFPPTDFGSRNGKWIDSTSIQFGGLDRHSIYRADLPSGAVVRVSP